jgi:hypothetical protein
MTLPQFPTDNMYKFMAIFGLTIALGSYVVVDWRVSNKALEKISLDREKLKYETERSYDSDVMKAYGDQIDEIDKEKNPDLKQISELTEIYDKTAQQYFQNEKNKVLDSEYKNVDDDIKLLNNALKYGIIVGSVLTVIGFILWYFKLQRYQDNLIKKEATKLH